MSPFVTLRQSAAMCAILHPTNFPLLNFHSVGGVHRTIKELLLNMCRCVDLCSASKGWTVEGSEGALLRSQENPQQRQLLYGCLHLPYLWIFCRVKAESHAPQACFQPVTEHDVETTTRPLHNHLRSSQCFFLCVPVIPSTFPCYWFLHFNVFFSSFYFQYVNLYISFT